VSVRAPTRLPARRRSARRAARRTRSVRRQRLVIAGMLAAGLVLGVIVANSDQFQKALRDVTLPLQHEDIIRQQAAAKDVPPDLIAAVIYAESRFRDQTSSAGARGLMQITPDTANEIERQSGGTTFKLDDLSDPQINISYGTYRLRYLLHLFDGNEVAAIAAYNAGPTRVRKWGGPGLRVDGIPLDETRGYVEEVLQKRDDYRDKYRTELGL
jgi:soluble lytic murein transglycosylase